MAEETKLTPTEAGAHQLQVREHKAHKCHRCAGREDLSVGFVCKRGEDAWGRMQCDKPCRKFQLDEDQSRWLA